MESGIYIVLFWHLVITHAYWFENGFQHHYTYSSTTNTLGAYNVSTVIKFQIRNVNATDGGVKLHELQVDSITIKTQDGYFFDNPKKWDLTKSFLFELEPNGLIQFVHIHPTDEFELRTIKKALAGTLSAKYEHSENDNWEYESTEIDHGGTLSHKYRGSKSKTGIILHKQHKSADEINRQHDRILHYNHQGLIHYVHSVDNLTSHHVKDEDGFHSTSHDEREPEISGEFPTINAFAESHLHLTNKKKLDKKPEGGRHEGLRREETTVRPKAPERQSLSKIENQLNILMNCVLSHAVRNHPNRTRCLHYLRHNISALQSDDFKDYMTRILSVKCSTGDDKCQEEKHVMIGILVHSDREDNQQLIHQMVLTNPETTESEMRQCLMHCIHLRSPKQAIISTIEDLCFENHIQNKTTLTSMSEIQKGACLTIGALAKTLKEEGQLNEAKRITLTIENWLQYHNESEFHEIYRPREKRSLEKSYEREENHIRMKRTLIHALGNAAHPDSLSYLQSYMKHDEGMPSLRRAASHALRHYECQESASTLLRSSLFDPEDVVRHTAFDVYSRHPMRKRLTKEQENMILERKYTYPIVSRIRKRSADKLLQENDFDVNLSQYNWGKNQGSGNIGSSSGLESDQGVKFHMTQVESVVTLKADKQSHSKANAGFVHKRFDNHRTKICDKKAFHYDLNVLNRPTHYVN